MNNETYQAKKLIHDLFDKQDNKEDLYIALEVLLDEANSSGFEECLEKNT